MSSQITKYVDHLRSPVGYLSVLQPLPVDNVIFQQRLLEQLREEEEFYYNNAGDSEELLPVSQTKSPVTQAYSLWQFIEVAGASLNGINLLFDPSTTVEFVWENGSVEQINSGVDYNHTFS